MSASNSNKLLKLKRKRGNGIKENSDNNQPNNKQKSSKQKKSTDNKKLETEFIDSDNFDDGDIIEGSKQENSLGQLTKNFLQYIKKKESAQININDLVNDLSVKKRRIYDITNVLQGIGFIEKNGKNEINWKKGYKNTKGDSSSLPSNYISDYNNLKIELENLKKENQEIEDKLNKFKEEFNLLSVKQDFSKYGYITFDDILNLSKNDGLDFIIIKAAKGTVINVIDDEESKRAYSKIKTQMENGKIQKNEKILSTLENTHHIFFTSKDEKLKIYRVDKGEIKETNKTLQFGAENNNNVNRNNDELINKNIIYNNNNSEIKSLKNKKNAEKDSIFTISILNEKENKYKSNAFNFDQSIFMNNSNENKYNINNDNKDKKNNNQMFTFENELHN
jgi:transcription factor E2F3